jgi:nucleotide-binding universal stress UspA family protein
MDDKSIATAPIAVGIADKQPSLLDFARAEAERASCGIMLVHAYTVPAVAMGSMYGIEVPEAFRAAGQDVLDEAAHHLTKRGVTASIGSVLTHGDPATALEEATRSARLMIIGPDDHKPWYGRLFEGQVARHQSEHAECPVIVVPDSWERSHDNDPVVVMVDAETNARGPLQFAFETALARGSDLRVLHVATPEDSGRDTHWEAIRRVVGAWFDRHPHVHGEIQVVDGDVREAALRASDGTGLLIVGRPHERHVTSILSDSVAQEIIAGSGCPVAVVAGSYRPHRSAGE